MFLPSMSARSAMLEKSIISVERGVCMIDEAFLELHESYSARYLSFGRMIEEEEEF